MSTIRTGVDISQEGVDISQDVSQEGVDISQDISQEEVDNTQGAIDVGDRGWKRRRFEHVVVFRRP